jgi:hypothetical protein
MKTIIVQFTPRSGSTTAQLVAHARAQLKGPVEVIDLATRTPARGSRCASSKRVRSG